MGTPDPRIRARSSTAAELRRLRVRLEDKEVILALHWRGAPDERAARAALDAVAAKAGDAGLWTHWGRKVLEVRPPVRDRQGCGRPASARRRLGRGRHRTSATTPPTSTLSARCASWLSAGRLAHAVAVGVASEDGPPEITAEADVVVEGTQGVLDLLTPARGAIVRFTDFLRSTVYISLAAASALAAVTIAGAGSVGDQLVVAGRGRVVDLGGRDRDVARPPSTMPRRRSRRCWPARARSRRLPEVNPGRTILNRLWPLLVCTIGAGALAFVLPQVPAVATGFAIIWSLAWRRQASAVAAIEERDGARFYVARTSPWRPIALVRTPGFRSNLFELNGSSRGGRRARPRV